MGWVWSKDCPFAHLFSKPILEFSLEKVQKFLICFEYPLAKIDSEGKNSGLLLLLKTSLWVFFPIKTLCI